MLADLLDEMSLAATNTLRLRCNIIKYFKMLCLKLHNFNTIPNYASEPLCNSSHLILQLNKLILKSLHSDVRKI